MLKDMKLKRGRNSISWEYTMPGFLKRSTFCMGRTVKQSTHHAVVQNLRVSFNIKYPTMHIERGA